MGGAFSSSYSRLFGKQETRIIMLGLDAAGKTSILYKLQLGEVKTTIPTIGFNVETVECCNRTSLVTFTTWDVGGRDKIRPLWRHYYKHANALVYVVDSNDRDRYEEAGDELMRVLSEDECRDWPVLVFANKQDLPNAMTVQEVTDKLKLQQLHGRSWYIQGSCATTGDGLYEGLDWLAATVNSGKGHKSQPESQIKDTPIQGRPAKQEAKPAEVAESDADTEVPESVGAESTEQEM